MDDLVLPEAQCFLPHNTNICDRGLPWLFVFTRSWRGFVSWCVDDGDTAGFRVIIFEMFNIVSRENTKL